MKKLVLAAAILANLIVGVMPAHAGGVTTNQAPNVPFVFPVAATIPCSVALTADICAYNTAASSLGYRACENPFPDQSFYDVLTQPAPTPPAGKKMILELYTTPDTDWDTWICGLLSNGDRNGGELAQGANILGELCDNFLGPDNPVPVGCIETAQAPAEAGKRYVLRSYNYFDIANDPGIYKWIFV